MFFGAVWSGRGLEAMTVAARSELSRLRTTGLSAEGAESQVQVVPVPVILLLLVCPPIIGARYGSREMSLQNMEQLLCLLSGCEIWNYTSIIQTGVSILRYFRRNLRIEKIQVAADRTILTQAAFPIAHLKADVLRIPKMW